MNEEAIAAPLASQLLAADAADRPRLLSDADDVDVAAALDTLGHTHTPAAAEVLVVADAVLADRALRKQARRELHRLRAAGVPLPEASSIVTAPARSEPVGPEVDFTEAWATAIDSDGSRRLWLIGSRPLGGVWLVDLLLNDRSGMQDLQLVDTTRKRVQRELGELRRDARWSWTSLPPAYALGLVGEGVTLAESVDHALPQRYQRFVELFGAPPPAPEGALVYETISPMEIRLHPDWLEESGRLIAEPELAGWDIPPTPELRDRALAAARARFATLLVPTNPPEAQAAAVLAEAGRTLITPERRQALRRRLEEMAYVFLAADRLDEARLAAAAAQDLRTSSQPAHEQPFLRALLIAGAARALQAEVVAGRSAAQTFVELTEQPRTREDQPPAISTTSTGLILPR
ncbi:MAG: hypothetical protein JO023_12220 [Chloroflexi bacterium]|nr:hypothetical protein [Chloroflexota bacterium]